MPLPAALQARLQKRGLVHTEPEEAIEEVVEEEGDVDEEIVQPPPKKNYKQTALPPGWFKVPDPQTNREYYWNVHTNQVSWRHPVDPLAEVTYPACWQKKVQVEAIEEKEKKEKVKDSTIKNDGERKDVKSKSKVKTGRHPSLLKAQKQKEKVAPYRKNKNKGDDPLDPMDPASYSEVGRGTWSSGLIEEAEQKTGVDTTVNGPLFQQRPYPSPGDILRRNRKVQKTEANSDDDGDDDDDDDD